MTEVVADVQAVPWPLKISPSLRQLEQDWNTSDIMMRDVIIELSPGSKGSMAQVKTLASVWQSAVDNNVVGSRSNFTAEANDMIALRQLRGKDLAKALQIVSSQPEALVLEEIPDNTRIDPAPGGGAYTLDITGRRINDDADDITQSGEIGNTPLRAAGLNGANE